MRIAFLYAPVAFGIHRPPIDFQDVEAYGLTGTDLVLVCYARELSKRGHTVHIFCDRATPSTFGLVSVYSWENWTSATAKDYDVAIATSNPNALAACPESTLRLVNRQVAEFGADCDPGWEQSVDLIMCPSKKAVDMVSKPLAPETRRKFRVLPNGCYPEAFGALTTVPGRVAYLSSPDRGLHWLLRCWPEIRRRVPHATLRIYYYDLLRWLEMRTNDMWRDTEEWRRAHYVRFALERLKDFGVEAVGGVPHRHVPDVLGEAEVLAYPCDPMQFTETFSVAILEACAAGCVPVISGADALAEVHGGVCPMVAPPMGERVEQFTGLVERALTDEAWRQEVRAKTIAHAHAHAWPLLAERLERLIEDGIEAKRSPAVVRSLERPRFDLVLTPYAAGTDPIDLDDRTGDSTSGGCREGFLGLVRELPALGYDVRAYSVFRAPLKRGGVDYRHITEFVADDRRDAVLAYYDTAPLVGVPRGSCLRIGSHHTFRPPSVAWWSTDVNLAPSQYAVDVMRPVFDHRAPWYVLPNAVPEGLPKWAPVPGRVIYHTSPDRGLHHLLEMWPAIRAWVPHATLHVVGKVVDWVGKTIDHDTCMGDFARRVAAGIEVAGNAGGLELLGRLPRHQLNQELAEAACFAFPCDVVAPTETFSVSVMECLAIGVPVVLMPQDALENVYRVAGPRPAVCFAHSPASFVSQVVNVLTGLEAAVLSDGGRTFAKKFTYANTASALDAIVKKESPRVLRAVAEAAQ